MKQEIKHIALLVADYDEAIEFYTKKLHFELIEDRKKSETKRWVVIAPPGSTGFSLKLAKATNEEQRTRVGNQTGGRMFLFLHTDNIERDNSNLIKHGIKITRPLSNESHGKVLIFEDLYGNRWDLIEPK